MGIAALGGALAGVVAEALMGVLVGVPTATLIDDATLTQIEAEMTGDGVWVDPAFARAHDISADDEERFEQWVASAEQAELRVVLVEVDGDDDRFQGSFSNLSAWIHDSVGGDVTFVGWDRYGHPSLQAHAYGDQPDTLHVTDIAMRDEPDDIVAQIGRTAELLENGQAESLWEQIPREERYPWTAKRGVGDVLRKPRPVELAVGGLLLAVFSAMAIVVVRHRRRPKGFVLPRTVLRTVRAAEDRRLRTLAEREVLALGEAVGSAEQSPGSPAALLLWQDALDHYAAARTVLDQATTPADVVGALVLSRRGEQAREAAVAGAGANWTAHRVCWFNPLHEGRVREVGWSDEHRRVRAPACPLCAEAVERGREPDDVLDFVEGDRTVHYYRTDLGVWSETGYGALDGDLLGALRRRRRRWWSR